MGSAAHEAIEYIRKLYAVETDAEQRSLDETQRADLRRSKTVPMLDEFHGWLMKLQDQTPPQGLLGKAVNYTLGQWDRLERYVQHGMLRPDNNLAENAIRPFVVGERIGFSARHPGGAGERSTLQRHRVSKSKPTRALLVSAVLVRRIDFSQDCQTICRAASSEHRSQDAPARRK